MNKQALTELQNSVSKFWVCIMNQYKKNTEIKVCSPDKETDFFDNVTGVLQEDTLAPYLFIIFLDYVLRMSIDLMKENGFTLKKGVYIALLANTPTKAKSILHSLEQAGGIGLHVNGDKIEHVF